MSDAYRVSEISLSYRAQICRQLSLLIRCITLLPSFIFRNSRLYFNKLVIHLWFKVLSIAGHYFLPSSGQCTKSRIEETGHILKRFKSRSNFLLLHKTESAGQPSRVPLIETSDSPKEQRLENTAEWGRTSHFNVSKYVLTTFATWAWALSCCKITLSCLSLYCGRFSFNARLKRIICVR